MYRFLKTRILMMAVMGLFVMAVSPASAVTVDDWMEDWSGSFFLGYNQTSGNTDKGALALDGTLTKEFDGARMELGGSLYYSQSDNKMDEQKWDAFAKYAYDFGEDDRWFTIYQVLVDHDRFADIDYRVTPSVGLGYHFARTEDWTWNADISAGYEITRHRINTAADDETAVLVGHTFAKKRILENAFLSEDLTVIPGLESGAGVRVRSKTAFTNPISSNLDLEVKYIVDYDSEPAEGKTSTDKQIIAGVKYNF